MSMTKKTLNVLSIAGSDSSAGAGIQADIKTIHSLGGFALTAITALTAQNTMGVTDVMPVSTHHLQAQLCALKDDITIHAIKIGMLFSEELIDVVSNFVTEMPSIPVVVDPVMVATSGARLLEKQAEKRLKDTLLPKATIITPNLAEAMVITGESDIESIVTKLQTFTSKAILIKDIAPSSPHATDYLITDGIISTLPNPKIESNNTHGTGCTLSSAIATNLAKSDSVAESVKKAKAYISKRIEVSRYLTFGHGHGPLIHLD